MSIRGIRHPGIDMVDRMRDRGDMDEQQIRNRLSDMKSSLNVRMAKDPASVTRENIENLHKLEVGLIYSYIIDPDNSTARNALNQALKGCSPTGQPLDSTQYRRQLDVPDTPSDRFTVKFDPGLS